MSRSHAALAALACVAATLGAPPARPQALADGTAVVRTGSTEYTIPILCDDAARPEQGFSTEPSRVTRENTGRTSGVNLRLRRWQDSDEVVVTLDRYAAWIPLPASSDGVLKLTLDMSPASVIRDGIPVALTYEMWTSGDRPEGISAAVEADCRSRDPDAPTTRRL